MCCKNVKFVKNLSFFPEEEVQQSAAADVAPEGGEGAAAADVAPEVGEGAAASDVAPEGESVAVSEDQQSTDKPADDGVQPTDDGAQPSDAKPSEEVKPPLGIFIMIFGY